MKTFITLFVTKSLHDLHFLNLHPFKLYKNDFQIMYISLNNSKIKCRVLSLGVSFSVIKYK